MPVMSKNSPTNPFVSGSATLPNKTIMNVVANQGATFLIPPSCEISCVCVRLKSISTTKNNPTTFIQCEIICSILPCNPCVVRENIPAEIKPTCAIEE